MTGPYESAVERQIRIAQEQGKFDNLPGKGKPLRGLDRPPDEDWWVRAWLDREGVSRDVLLPPVLQLRKEIESLPETLAAIDTEAEVAEFVRDLNHRIAEHLRDPRGPRVPIAPVNLDAAVNRWRHRPRAEGQGRRQPPSLDDAGSDRSERPPRSRRWWRR